MSQESAKWLNNNIIVGFTEKRGDAWWRDDRWAGFQNHYPGAVPLERAVEFFERWEPIEADLFFYDRDGKPRGDSKAGKTVYRSQPGSEYDYIRLGNHEAGWQNHDRKEWLIEYIADMIDTTAGDLGIASLGELKLGKVAWVQIEAPETIQHSSGLHYRPFIAATTSFDGTIATTYKSGETAVVCDNTHAMYFRGNDGTYKVKHTKHSTNSARIADARAALDIIFKISETFSEQLDTLSATTVTDKQWEAFLDAYAPMRDDMDKRGKTLAENKRIQLTELYNVDERAATWRGTALGVLQAINTYQHHFATVRNTASRIERQWTNFLEGKTDAHDSAALEQLNAILA